MTIHHEQEEDLKSSDRKYDRFDIALKVYDEGGNFLGVTTNVSREGLFIESDKDINWDEICLILSIELPDNMGTLKLEALVVMGKQGGYGVTIFPKGENKRKYEDFIESLSKRKKNNL